MFGISGEHLLVLGIVLLIFGPRRLPELGNTLGKAIRNFKDAVSGIEEAKFRKLEENGPKPESVTQAHSQLNPVQPEPQPLKSQEKAAPTASQQPAVPPPSA